MDLWAHQERVYDLLKEGKNVILQSPTGSGKTRAALYPFLCGCDPSHEMSGKLPAKCIYSVPMRVLAKQFESEFRDTIAAYNRTFQLDLSVRIQTGEQPDAPDFAGNLIFATIDQTLSSFLVSPYSLPRRAANLNAAAVMGSYLVFDEFHLFDPATTLPTTLHMLQMLDVIAPFVLMTATFSADMLDGLAHALNAVVVPGGQVERDALLRLPSQNKTRRYHLVEGALTADAVWKQHRTRSLVICNTVDRARQMAQDLARVVDDDINVLLLHSRFLPQDRNTTEDMIRRVFGKDAPRDGNIIVVSTQAIEVGVDITCENLHTELAPANAIIQRAGRCARYPGDSGDVYIYTHILDSENDAVDLLTSLHPYSSQAAEFVLTRDAFANKQGELTFADEQAVLSVVHGERDRLLIQNLQVGAPEHRNRMYAVMRADPSDDARNLVRDITRQSVTISADPDSLCASPYEAPAFGLHPGTLQGYVKAWLARANEYEPEDLPFGVKYLQEAFDPEAEQANRTVYKWEPVRRERDIIGAPLVVVHPKLASYHPKLGFLPHPHPEANWEATLPLRDKQGDARRDPQRYRLETYEDHIRRVYEAAFEHAGIWSEMEGAAARLERRFALPRGVVRQAAELAVTLHDVGKLSRGWQEWIVNYQRRIGQPTTQGEAYAHTEWQQGNQKHDTAAKAAGKRPWHAVEGGLAVTPILIHTYGEGHPLAQAVFSAIARHHAPHSASTQGFRLTRDSARHIRNTLNGRSLPLETLVGIDETIPSGEVGELNVLAEPGKEQNAAFLIYLLLARVLRRADQLGTKRGTLGG